MSDIAPEGSIWVCTACGKTSNDKYGDPGSGWDVSCMMNSVLTDFLNVQKPLDAEFNAAIFSDLESLYDE